MCMRTPVAKNGGNAFRRTNRRTVCAIVRKLSRPPVNTKTRSNSEADLPPGRLVSCTAGPVRRSPNQVPRYHRRRRQNGTQNRTQLVPLNSRTGAEFPAVRHSRPPAPARCSAAGRYGYWKMNRTSRRFRVSSPALPLRFVAEND